MTGTTTGQTALPTATDSDDTESFLTTSLVTVEQTLANLFESGTGHDHAGSGKGKPITTAGIASGITLTSPHFTSPVVDSGGLVVTAGALTLSGATTQHSIASGSALAIGAITAAGGSLRLPNGANNGTIAWRNAAASGDIVFSFGTGGVNDQIVVTGAAAVATTASTGASGAPPAQVAGYILLAYNGTNYKVPVYLV